MKKEGKILQAMFSSWTLLRNLFTGLDTILWYFLSALCLNWVNINFICTETIHISIDRHCFWDFWKNPAPKSAFFGIFLPYLVKYGNVTLPHTAWSFDFQKLQYNSVHLQKTASKLVKNWGSNNFFRVVRQKWSCYLRLCRILFFSSM